MKRIFFVLACTLSLTTFSQELDTDGYHECIKKAVEVSKVLATINSMEAEDFKGVKAITEDYIQATFTDEEGATMDVKVEYEFLNPGCLIHSAKVLNIAG